MLDEQELQAGMQDFMELFQMQNLDIQKIFKEMDTDGNGTIEHEEFMNAAMDRTMFLNELNLKKAFESLDKDGNGEMNLVAVW